VTHTTGSPTTRLPLSALLSQALVAFTIEFDNEFENQLPHRTTKSGGRGPWLTSRAMYENCMRYVSDVPITVAELTRLARTGSNLPGMARWGYLETDGDPKHPTATSVLTATRAGLKARQIWAPLDDLIEQRWQDRFGATVSRLSEALAAIAGGLGHGLPDCLPILRYGLRVVDRDAGPTYDFDALAAAGDGDTELALPALISRVLLAFALEYESELRLSIAVGADVLRLLGDEPRPLRELPRASGVSKEAVAMAIGFLAARDCIAVEQLTSPGRGKSARLTERGRRGRTGYFWQAGNIEERWQRRFGPDTVSQLRESLEQLILDPASWAALLDGIDPYPDGWRFTVPPPVTLPHFPMVLHRGGYPDGS
jgi:hypothetical protein